MARPLKHEPICRVSIVTTLQGEEPVAALLESIFGEPASTYANLERGECTATVYLKEPLSKLRFHTPEIEAGLTAIQECGVDLGKPKIQVEKVPREDWSESWKKYFKTIEIGRSLLIKPSWSKRKGKKNQAVVILDPGLSFGTGQHATTSFCLRQLVECKTRKRAQPFLDMGCGSGILSIAACKLGYSPVEGFDFDPLAVRVAIANCKRNRVEQKIGISRKDLRKLSPGSRKKFEVVCANLVADLLIEQRDKILNRVASGGILVLAGILATQFAEVQKVYESVGCSLIKSKLEREWQSGAFTIPANIS